MVIVLDNDLLIESGRHKPIDSVAPQPIKRLDKARILTLTILLHFILYNNDNSHGRIAMW